jgi:hypothetical protein
VLICDGLPPIDGFTALLRGDWQRSGWNEQSFADLTGLSGGPAAAEEA